MMLRSTKRVSQHTEFLSLLISHGPEMVAVLRENGVDTSQTPGTLNLSRSKERSIIRQVKERVNGSDHSRQES